MFCWHPCCYRLCLFVIWLEQEKPSTQKSKIHKEIKRLEPMHQVKISMSKRDKEVTWLLLTGHFFIISSIVVLNLSHVLLTSLLLSIMSVCDLIRAVLMPSSSAFFHSNIFLRSKDWNRYTKLKSACQREIRKSHDSYLQDIVSGDMKNNSKKLWSYIKHKKQDSSGVAPLKDTPMLLVCQDVPTLEMVHYLAVKDMFQYFTRYGREWNWPIVWCLVSVSFLK
jgi:hypothetical protein